MGTAIFLATSAWGAEEGEQCTSYLDCDRQKGIYCSDEGKPGKEVNSCMAGHCVCIKGEPTHPYIGPKSVAVAELTNQLNQQKDELAQLRWQVESRDARLLALQADLTQAHRCKAVAFCVAFAVACLSLAKLAAAYAWYEPCAVTSAHKSAHEPTHKPPQMTCTKTCESLRGSELC